MQACPLYSLSLFMSSRAHAAALRSGCDLSSVPHAVSSASNIKYFIIKPFCGSRSLLVGVELSPVIYLHPIGTYLSSFN
jgi:hypothetical protein